MQMKNEFKSILLTRHYLVINEKCETIYSTNHVAYLNAFLLTNFGIVVDKPNYLTPKMVNQISDEFHLAIPKSFYSNPQDTKYFSKDELLIEQLVSYFAYGSDLGRIEIFKKDLPEYVVGDELKLRTFYIVTEEEANKILYDIMAAYCTYTRPFSVAELCEVIALFSD